MKAELLDVIAVVSNPLRWESREALFIEAVRHLVGCGIRLTVVECAYGDIPHRFENLPGVFQHIKLRAKTHAWIKENLMQVGLTRLPADAKYIGIVDGDIEFQHKDWASEAVYALQYFDVIQPFDHCLDLGPHGEVLQVHRSFCSVFHRRPDCIGRHGHGYEFAHPGYAWCFTRRALDVLGGFSLLEHAVCGSGDHHLALALAHKVRASIPGNIHPNYLAPLIELERRAIKHITKNIHYLSHSIKHFWHGHKENRYYKDRWRILTENNFDPLTDIKKNVSGVVELAGNKPQLKMDLHKYFQMRREDAR